MGLNHVNGGKFIGKYQILGVVGRGSTGIVYKALDPEIERVVALKTLFKVDAETEPDRIVKKMRAEARSAGKLRHPHIAQVFEVGLDANLPFIVMEYIDGDTLDSLLSTEGRLPLERGISVLKQLALAIDYAHSEGVIHRDLKPANILVGQNGHLSIVDFGVASLQCGNGRDAKKFNSSSNSAYYMAPEVIRNEVVRVQADLFSFAVIAYEILSGVRPFVGKDPYEVMQSVLSSSPPRLCGQRSIFSETSDLIFSKALSKHPEARFESATQFFNALQEALPSASVEDTIELSPFDGRGQLTEFPSEVEGAVTRRAVDPILPLTTDTRQLRKAYIRFRSAAMVLALTCFIAGSSLLWDLLTHKSSEPEFLYAPPSASMLSAPHPLDQIVIDTSVSAPLSY